MASTEYGPKGFTPDQLPNLSGKTYAITGANSGIGKDAARYLGEKGARVLMLCRNQARADDARRDLERKAPGGQYEVVLMDLADLSDVRAAAEKVKARTDKLDALILNAGVMALPKRTLTDDGFEMQWQVNVLSHFLLAALLEERVETAAGRYVWLSSIAHRYAKNVPPTDMAYKDGYSPITSYAKSKLADMVLSQELHRRLREAGKSASSIAVHPGVSDTSLVENGLGKIAGLLAKPVMPLISQPAAKGALPTVLAAAYPKAESGGYYGPTGFREMKGPVGEAAMKPWGQDKAQGKRLWIACEDAVGQTWNV